MAIAERSLASRYNRPGCGIVNHYTYAMVSGEDMEEGVTGEVASLAGVLRLGRLIYLYADSRVQIEGSTDRVFGDNVARRFEAYGWQVVRPVDGNRVDQVEQAIREAQADTERPSLIICQTIIGYGRPTDATNWQSSE